MWRRFKAKGWLEPQASLTPWKAAQKTVFTYRQQLFGVKKRLVAEQFADLAHHAESVAEQQNTMTFEQQLIVLLAKTPQAVLAQRQMDKHRGGFSNRANRLMELISFNDAFVDTVLLSNSDQKRIFDKQTQASMQHVCKKFHTPCFSNEQFMAIARGLSREIALYTGAKDIGYDVHMTSRVADGLGVDMQIRDPESGFYINVDCKTHSSFRHRVGTLVREGRVREQDVEKIFQEGSLEVENGHGSERVKIVLFDVSKERIGTIENYSLKDYALLRPALSALLTQYGRADGDFYRYEQ